MSVDTLLAVAEEIAYRALTSGNYVPDHEIAQALSIAYSVKEDKMDPEIIERADAVIAALT